MYKIIYLVGFLIRQFALPNPFTPFGNDAELINLIVGGAFVPLSYFMVGLIYERGSAPTWGSILFTIVYAINTGVTYESFISVFRLEETPYFIEHNELLTTDEVNQMVDYVMSNLDN